MGHVPAPPSTNSAIACAPQADDDARPNTAEPNIATSSLVCGGDLPSHELSASSAIAAAAGSPGATEAGPARRGADAPSANGSEACTSTIAASSSEARAPARGEGAPSASCDGSEQAGSGRTANATNAIQRGSGSPCHLLVVGDSLSDAKSGGGGYWLAMNQRCRCKVTSLAKGGAMVNQMRALLFEHLEAAPHYSHVIVFGGVNDLYSDLTAKRTVAKITSDLELMYDAMHQRRTEVIAITVTPWGGFRRYFTDHRWQNTLTLNQWIRGTHARGLTDQVIDGERLLACGEAERLCDAYAAPYRDGLHFGPLGHQRLAEELARALGPVYCPVTPDDGSNRVTLDESEKQEPAH